MLSSFYPLSSYQYCVCISWRISLAGLPNRSNLFRSTTTKYSPQQLPIRPLFESSELHQSLLHPHCRFAADAVIGAFSVGFNFCRYLLSISIFDHETSVASSSKPLMELHPSILSTLYWILLLHIGSGMFGVRFHTTADELSATIFTKVWLMSSTVTMTTQVGPLIPFWTSYSQSLTCHYMFVALGVPMVITN
jgi:hypothetical protein